MYLHNYSSDAIVNTLCDSVEIYCKPYEIISELWKKTGKKAFLFLVVILYVLNLAGLSANDLFRAAGLSKHQNIQ
jgi:hypothetical protein